MATQSSASSSSSPSSGVSPIQQETAKAEPMYLGFPPYGTQKVSQPLIDLGLRFIRANPSALQVVCINSNPTPMYPMYVRNLSAFMLATLNQQKLKISQGFHSYPPPTATSVLIPLPMPPLAIEVEAPLAGENESKAMEFGAIKRRVQGKETYTFPCPTQKLLSFVKDLKANRDMGTAVNTISVNAMITYRVCLNILSGLLRTHNYPSAKGQKVECILSDEESDINLTEAIRNKKRKSKASKTVTASAAEEETDPVIHSEDDISSSSTPTTQLTPNMADMKVAEKPSPKKTVLVFARPSDQSIKPWGNIHECIRTSGIYSPYIPEMAGNDEEYVCNFLTKYCIRSFGTTIESCTASMSIIRKHWTFIGKCDAAKAMTHVFFCLAIALETECQAYPIFSQDSHYEGCVILGEDFKVAIKDRVYAAVDHERLMNMISTGASHEKALREIRQMSHIPDDTEFKTMRELSITLLRIHHDDISKKKIEELARHLKFTGVYWPFNVDRFNDTISTIIRAQPIQDISVPMHPAAILSTDIVLSALSAYGFVAPSFNYRGGRNIALNPKTAPPANFIVSRVPLTQAVIDMNEVIRTKTITNNPENYGAATRHFVVTKADQKKMLYQSICRIVRVPESEKHEEPKGAGGKEEQKGFDFGDL